MNYIPKFRKTGLAGFSISFIGTLPFGVLNVLAFFITLSESFLDAVLFSLGVVAVELVYVSLTLYGASRFRLNGIAANLITVLLMTIIVVVACAGLLDALSAKPFRPVLPEGIPRFFLGLGLSAANALQLPFWMGWNALLIERGLLFVNRSAVIPYLIGIGMGTLSGLLLFMLAALVAGQHALAYFREIKLCISCILFATAIFMGCKMLVGERAQARKRLKETSK